jgi:hypothetical protein
VIDRKLSRLWLSFKDEDYTNAVCLLLPKGHATIVDIEHFDWAVSHDWHVMGRSIFYVVRTPVIYWELPWIGGRKQRKRMPAKSYMVSFTRELFLEGLDSIERHNLSLRLRRRDLDHINRNPWDNRRKNIRVATRSQNLHNTSKMDGKSSKYKGVCKKRPNSWCAAATVRGKRYYLGTFRDEVQAAIAYNKFVADRCGEFAVLNPIVALPTDEPCECRSRKRFTRVSRRTLPASKEDSSGDWRKALGEAIQAAKQAEAGLRDRDSSGREAGAQHGTRE